MTVLAPCICSLKQDNIVSVVRACSITLSSCLVTVVYVPRPCEQDIGSGNCAVHNTWIAGPPAKERAVGALALLPVRSPAPASLCAAWV